MTMGLFDKINDLLYPYQEPLDTPEKVEEHDQNWEWTSSLFDWGKSDQGED
jgi:hypothetical protein